MAETVNADEKKASKIQSLLEHRLHLLRQYNVFSDETISHRLIQVNQDLQERDQPDYERFMDTLKKTIKNHKR